MDKERMKDQITLSPLAEGEGPIELVNIKNLDFNDPEAACTFLERYHAVIDNLSSISENPIEAAQQVNILDVPQIDPENQEQNLFLAGVRMEALQNQAKLTPKQGTDIEGFKQNFLGELFWKIAEKNSKNVRIVASVITATSMLAASCNGRVPTHTVTTEAIIPAITETYTPTPESTPTSTFTPEPTEVPIPEGLKNIPDGYSAVHNSDGTWGYGVGTGTEVSPIPDLTVDQAGAHFIINGTEIDIPSSEIQERIKIGQEGALQIYNEQKIAIDYAYDAENKVWIKVSDVLQPNKNNTENFIVADSDEALLEEFRLEKLVLSPFPSDTYWPSPSDLDVDYEENLDVTPFGNVPDLSKAPTRLGVNHIIWGDEIIITEQVYNPADGTFSCLHFFRSVKTYNDFLQYIADPRTYLIPGYLFDSHDTSILNIYEKTALDFLVKRGYYTYGSAKFPKVESLVATWLTTGKVPEALENIITFGKPVAYLSW